MSHAGVAHKPQKPVFGGHESSIFKTYPMGMTLEPLPVAPRVTAGSGLMERLEAIQKDAMAGRERLAPMWDTVGRNSFKPPPGWVPPGEGGEGMEEWDDPNRWKRDCKFTYTFQEPGGGFRMFSDTGLGSLIRAEERRALHEEAKAKRVEERRKRIEDLVKSKEDLLLKRREARESRRREQDTRNYAAAKIQAMHRGRVARRRVTVYKEKRLEYAAARVQWSFRQHLDRKDARSELERRRDAKQRDQAARLIQRTGSNKVRRNQAKAVVETRRRQVAREREEMELKVRDEGAARVQALYRGRKGRERASEVARAKKREVVVKKQERRLADKVTRELDKAGSGGARGGSRTSSRKGDKPGGPTPDPDRIGGPFGLSGGAGESKK